MYYLVGCAALITGIYYYRYEIGIKLLYTANEAIKSYHRFTSKYTKDNKEKEEEILEEKTISLIKYNKETYAKNLKYTNMCDHTRKLYHISLSQEKIFSF